MPTTRPRLPSSNLALTTGSMRASRAGATDPQPTRARCARSYPGVYRAWLFASADAAFASGVPTCRRGDAPRVECRYVGIAADTHRQFVASTARTILAERNHLSSTRHRGG